MRILLLAHLLCIGGELERLSFNTPFRHLAATTILSPPSGTPTDSTYWRTFPYLIREGCFLFLVGPIQSIPFFSHEFKAMVLSVGRIRHNRPDTGFIKARQDLNAVAVSEVKGLNSPTD